MRGLPARQRPPPPSHRPRALPPSLFSLSRQVRLHFREEVALASQEAYARAVAAARRERAEADKASGAGRRATIATGTLPSSAVPGVGSGASRRSVSIGPTGSHAQQLSSSLLGASQTGRGSLRPAIRTSSSGGGSMTGAKVFPVPSAQPGGGEAADESNVNGGVGAARDSPLAN